jgi:hypothetical protein
MGLITGFKNFPDMTITHLETHRKHFNCNNGGLALRHPIKIGSDLSIAFYSVKFGASGYVQGLTAESL